MNINNAGIYDAAYNGFIGGATEYRSTTSTSPAAYTTLQSVPIRFPTKPTRCVSRHAGRRRPSSLCEGCGEPVRTCGDRSIPVFHH